MWLLEILTIFHIHFFVMDEGFQGGSKFDPVILRGAGFSTSYTTLEKLQRLRVYVATNAHMAPAYMCVCVCVHA